MGKHYSSEYKEYVCKMVVEEGRKASEVAYELEIPYTTMTKWVQKYKQAKNSKHDYVTPSEFEKLKKQHEKEMKALQEENEILKKAMHIFTKKTD
ncbi:transposase [Bacillus sp. AK031]